jgi:hypothetical protein
MYRQVAMFWAAAVGIVLAGYWLCLKFLFPGYFAPLSAFHVDFYDYAASAVHPYSILLTRYSRPASFAVAKFLADAGFPTLLAGEIVIALLSVLLTLAFAQRTLGLYSNRVLAPFAIYVVVLFGHPEFYAVHRHDLAAESAYLFLLLGLLAWLAFVDARRTLGPARRVILAIGAVSCTAMSAFSKETYFVAALCLLAGLAFSGRQNRRSHAAFFVLLVILVCCSYGWNRHIGWPPANVSSDYKMSLALSDLARTYYFYLRHFLNPAFILLPLIGIATVARDRSRFVLGCAFVLAGLAVFIPHAILPNHLDSEYAWLAAPLFLAPVLLIGRPARPMRLSFLNLVTAVVAVLVIAGPGGYWWTYQTPAERWFVEQDRKGAAMVQSLNRLRAIPRPSRVLVVGLEDTSIPWEAGDFLHDEFGDRILWSVVLPESIEYRRSSPLADFPHAADLKLENFDRIATFNSSDRLLNIQPVAAIPASEVRSEVIVPALKPLLEQARARPHDPKSLLASAQIAINWGLWADAENFLGEAKRDGAPDATTAPLLTQIRAAVAKAAANPHEVTLVARPDHVIQPDGSGLGEVELFWTVPDGVASEVHVNAPDGALFARSSGSGQARTGKWVSNGMQFFLQDVSGGKPLTKEHTLSRVQVRLSR